MSHFKTKTLLCLGTALSFAQFSAAHAQEGSDYRGLQDIIVTAQKREQSVQDVPIAVTAVTQDTITANRIVSVNDLSSIAPGVSVRQTTGSTQSPAFTIRGQLSYGFVPGSDKQTSIYLDGVYIGSPRGSIFDLPDIQRLEVLRGPQGTLFGRNATAGAVSVVTRDPTGDAGVKAEFSFGNLHSRRYRLSAETPEFGPFSAYFSFLRNERNGDIRNAGAGTIWDRSLSPGYQMEKSPKYLGSVDSNSYFAAVKFEPSDIFKMTYKYDRFEDQGTPDGTAPLNFNVNVGGNPLTANILTALRDNNDLYLAPDGKRPKVVANSWVVPRNQNVQGHSLTSVWQASDNLTIKNITSHRRSFIYAASPIDGVSALTFPQQAVIPYATLSAFSLIGTPTGAAMGIVDQVTAQAAIPNFIPNFQPLVGRRMALIATGNQSNSKQWSSEFQVNYTQDRLNITAGALWFRSKDKAGSVPGLRNTISYRFGTNTIYPTTGRLPLGDAGINYNKTTSMAGYIHGEFEVVPTITLVGGVRLNYDKKTGSFEYEIGTAKRPTIIAPKYTDTRLSYSAGVNWQPSDQTLVYGKYSQSFVSGGNTSGVEFAPEVAKSFELGLKTDLFDRRLRANLALFHVDYKHSQGSGSGAVASSQAYLMSYWLPLYGQATANELLGAVGTFVIDTGTLRAKGFELELTAAPVSGIILGASAGYTDTKLTKVNPLHAAALGTNDPTITDRPKWTGNAYAQYTSPPISGDMTFMARVDAQYRSRTFFQSNPTAFLLADGSNKAGLSAPAYTLVNGRVALQNIPLAGVNAEIAAWGRNLTNRKDTLYALALGYTTAANYVTARTYGVDLKIQF